MKYILIIIFSIIDIGICFGQQSDTLLQSDLPQTWSLEQCIQYAKNKNISINTLRLTKKTDEQSLLLSKSAILPNLYGSVTDNYTHSNEKTISAVSTSGISVSTAGTMGLTSSMTLYNGGTLRNNIKINQLTIQGAGLDIQASENSISLSILQYYINIMMAKETINYYKDLVKTDSAVVLQMKQQFDVGTAAKKDLIQLTAQLANDQYSLTQAENTERTDKIYLKQLLQLPSYINFEITQTTTDQLPSKNVTVLNEVMDSAMQNRPEVKSSALQIDIAKLNLKNALAGYKPTISLSGALGSSYSNNGGAMFSQLNNNFYQQIGLTASIPIFTRRTNKTNKEKAKIAISQAELDLQNTKIQLSQAIEQAYVTTQNNLSALDASIEQLKYNTESYRISGEELKVGSSNTVEYVQQKNLYIQALQTFTNAKYNALLAEKVYQFYKGSPLTIN